MDDVLSEEEALTDVNDVDKTLSQQYIRCEHFGAIIEMIINDIETHEKYRILKLLQAIAQFLDDGAFALLALSIFIQTYPNVSVSDSLPSDETVQTQIIENPFLFTIFVCDALYHVLSNKTHIWIFKRLNLYVVCIFNILYLIIFSVKKYWNPLISIIYTVRVFGFVYELFTLYCWDLEIAYDLSNKRIMELWKCDNFKKICTRYNNQSTERLYNRTDKSNDKQYLIIMHETRIFYFKCTHTNSYIVSDEVKGYVQADNILKLPDGCTYCGSICSWTIYNVFNWIPKKEDINDRDLLHWLVRILVRVIIAIVVSLVGIGCSITAALVSFIGWAIVMIFSCCKGCCNCNYKNLLIGEFIHEKSI